MSTRVENNTGYEITETLNMVFKCRYCGTKLNTSANLPIGELIVHINGNETEFSSAGTIKSERRRMILESIGLLRRNHTCNKPDVYFLEAYAISPYTRQPIKIYWRNL